MNCDTCAYYMYDEEDDAWYCEADLDEDDVASLRGRTLGGCRFYRNGDEYAVVRHQI